MQLLRRRSRHASQTEQFISVDIEADGPVPGIYSMASIGACVVGAPQLRFSITLKPISDRYVDKAVAIMAEGGLIRDELMMSGTDPAEAMAAFRAWIKEASGDLTPVFVAHNATFDWMFVHWYFVRYLEASPFGFAGLDTKAYLMGLLRLGRWSDTSAAKLPRKFRSRHPHTHDALDDAIGQGDSFAKMQRYAGRRRIFRWLCWR